MSERTPGRLFALTIERSPTTLRFDRDTVLIPLCGVVASEPSFGSPAGTTTLAGSLSALRLPAGRDVRVRSPQLWEGRALGFACAGEPFAGRGGLLAQPAEEIAASTGKLAAAWLAGNEAPTGLIQELLERLRRERAVEPRERAAGPRIEALRTRIEERLVMPPSLSSAAQEVRLHPVYLARIFRRRYGCSFGTYVHRRRIDRAAAALGVRRHQDLASLALDLGFADQSHLTRVFRRHLGLPPAAFARLLHSRAPRERDRTPDRDAPGRVMRVAEHAAGPIAM